MYRVINKYMENVNLTSDDSIYCRLTDYLKTAEGISKFSVNVNFNRYVVDIRLDNYSVQEAARVFREFDGSIAYDYSSMYLRFNEGRCVRYRYITCQENRDGFYCDIIFS